MTNTTIISSALLLKWHALNKTLREDVKYFYKLSLFEENTKSYPKEYESEIL